MKAREKDREWRSHLKDEIDREVDLWLKQPEFGRSCGWGNSGLSQKRLNWRYAVWMANPKIKENERRKEEKKEREIAKWRKENEEAIERARKAKEEEKAREEARKPENLSDEALKRELRVLDYKRQTTKDERIRKDALSAELMTRRERARQQAMLKKEEEERKKRIEQATEKGV